MTILAAPSNEWSWRPLNFQPDGLVPSRWSIKKAAEWSVNIWTSPCSEFLGIGLEIADLCVTGELSSKGCWFSGIYSGIVDWNVWYLLSPRGNIIAGTGLSVGVRWVACPSTIKFCGLSGTGLGTVARRASWAYRTGWKVLSCSHSREFSAIAIDWLRTNRTAPCLLLTGRPTLDNGGIPLCLFKFGWGTPRVQLVETSQGVSAVKLLSEDVPLKVSDGLRPSVEITCNISVREAFRLLSWQLILWSRCCSPSIQGEEYLLPFTWDDKERLVFEEREKSCFFLFDDFLLISTQSPMAVSKRTPDTVSVTIVSVWLIHDFTLSVERIAEKRKKGAQRVINDGSKVPEGQQFLRFLRHLQVFFVKNSKSRERETRKCQIERMLIENCSGKVFRKYNF